MNCEIKKPSWRNMRNFSIFNLLKNKIFKINLLCHICELETMCTLMYFTFTTLWKINSQIFYQVACNSQVARFTIHSLAFSNHSPTQNFSKLLCSSANVSKLRCNTGRKQLYQQWLLPPWRISATALIVAIFSLIYFNLFRDS